MGLRLNIAYVSGFRIAKNGIGNAIESISEIPKLRTRSIFESHVGI